MNSKLRTLVKKLMAKVLPDSKKLVYLAYLPRIKTFLNTHTEDYPVFENRLKLYDYINNKSIDNGTIEYLEFGVYYGASIKYWSNLNTNANSKFYGFDTFTGLPEKWENFTGSMHMNYHDVSGKYPQIDDKRVSFIKGLFQNTLPVFLKSFKCNSQLIINNDSDLYSSTLFVLTYASNLLVPGTIIIFDEFSSMLHEFRALEDYCLAYMRKYKVLAAVVADINYYSTVAIMFE
jgi:hypothetical protein